MSTLQIGLVYILSIFICIGYFIYLKFRLVKYLLHKIKRKNLHIKSILDIHSDHVLHNQRICEKLNNEIKQLKAHVIRLDEFNYSSRIRRRNRYWRS